MLQAKHTHKHTLRQDADTPLIKGRRGEGTERGRSDDSGEKARGERKEKEETGRDFEME